MSWFLLASIATNLKFSHIGLYKTKKYMMISWCWYHIPCNSLVKSLLSLVSRAALAVRSCVILYWEVENCFVPVKCYHQARIGAKKIMTIWHSKIKLEWDCSVFG